MNSEILENLIKSGQKLADAIEQKRPELINLLCKYESYDTAHDEISRSIRTLRGFSAEFKNKELGKKNYAISTFFPINLPLYSLILFAVAPSVFARKVFVRPPLVVADILVKLVECIELNNYITNIEIHSVGRKEFLDDCVEHSQVVIFNGRYENVQELIKEFPKKTFLYNGRGINPAVVGADADIDLAVKKIIEMRLFNSGQDCAGVDAVFVANEVHPLFLEQLKSKLDAVTIGDYSNPSVQLGKMQRPEYIDELATELGKVKDAIVVRGEIDRSNSVVTPFIVSLDIAEHRGHFPEFFGPVFYLLRYQDETQLLTALKTKDYADYAMYISTFGVEEATHSAIPNTRVLVNQIVNDVEIGNEAYGGYGPKANFIYRNGEYQARPILISQELSQ